MSRLQRSARGAIEKWAGKRAEPGLLGYAIDLMDSELGKMEDVVKGFKCPQCGYRDEMVVYMGDFACVSIVCEECSFGGHYCWDGVSAEKFAERCLVWLREEWEYHLELLRKEAALRRQRILDVIEMA